MKFKFTSLVAIFFIFAFYGINYYSQRSKKGCVVILNGVSSAGKSTLQKIISNYRTKEFWISFGFDYGVGMTVPQYSYSEPFVSNNYDFFCQNIRCDDENGPCIKLKYGPFGNLMLKSLNRAIKEYANQGINIAVDYLAYEKNWAKDLEECLKDIPHIWVKVYGEPEKIIEREKNRPGAVKGIARPYMEIIHDGIKYDLEINTTKENSDESFKKINLAIEKAKI